MDIQKERELFEAYMADRYKNTVDQRVCINSDGDYMAWDMQVAWHVWQSAKAQAVQEGFVLVSKDKLHEWKCMARRSEELGCPDCYESRGYAHNLAEEIQSEEQSK